MFTLSDCITRINQILNYPAVAYTDISHFFDQAISELNTSFRIGLPLVSDMVSEHTFKINEASNTILLNDEDVSQKNIIVSDTIPSDEEFATRSKVYYNISEGCFYKYSIIDAAWIKYPKLYGVHISSLGRTYYTAFAILDRAVWAEIDEKRLNDFDFTEYLPEEWLILFIIPYVCFKYSVRDGSDGSLYSDEFVQGFQQLQTSYDVPNFVELNKVAHLPAYTHIVKNNIANLNIKVPTRAVYNTMKVGNAVAPEYGGFNTRGGWGI